MLMLGTIEIPVTLFCDPYVEVRLRTSPLPRFRIYNLLDARNPACHIIGKHFGHIRFYNCNREGIWKRDFSLFSVTSVFDFYSCNHDTVCD